VPYKATIDEIDITDMADKIIYDQKYEKPTDEIVKKRLKESLGMAEKEENRFKYMLRKEMVKKNYWNARYTGTVIIEDKKIKYDFTLGKDGEKIRNLTKTVYLDKIYGKKNASECLSFLFLYDDSIYASGFTYGDGTSNKVHIEFYKTGKLKNCSLIINGEYHRLKWDEDGKLISQNTKKVSK
jgi:hypothetical protein